MDNKSGNHAYAIGDVIQRHDWLNKGCPFCGHDQIVLGPAGGMSQNFWCAKCRARFNEMGPFGIEITEMPTALPTAVNEV